MPSHRHDPLPGHLHTSAQEGLHDHTHDHAPAPARPQGLSLLMHGVPARLAGTLGLLLLLWLAVAWALGEPQ